MSAVSSSTVPDVSAVPVIPFIDVPKLFKFEDFGNALKLFAEQLFWMNILEKYEGIQWLALICIANSILREFELPSSEIKYINDMLDAGYNPKYFWCGYEKSDPQLDNRKELIPALVFWSIKAGLPECAEYFIQQAEYYKISPKKFTEIDWKQFEKSDREIWIPSLLFWAIKVESEECVKYFMEGMRLNKISMEVRDNAGDTCIHAAIKSHNVDLVKLILAEIPRAFYFRDGIDQTPLEVAEFELALIKAGCVRDMSTKVREMQTIINELHNSARVLAAKFVSLALLHQVEIKRVLLSMQVTFPEGGKVSSLVFPHAGPVKTNGFSSSSATSTVVISGAENTNVLPTIPENRVVASTPVSGSPGLPPAHTGSMRGSSSHLVFSGRRSRHASPNEPLFEVPINASASIPTPSIR